MMTRCTFIVALCQQLLIAHLLCPLAATPAPSLCPRVQVSHTITDTTQTGRFAHTNELSRSHTASGVRGPFLGFQAGSSDSASGSSSLDVLNIQEGQVRPFSAVASVGGQRQSLDRVQAALPGANAVPQPPAAAAVDIGQLVG
jgi:hypothetical protein